MTIQPRSIARTGHRLLSILAVTSLALVACSNSDSAGSTTATEAKTEATTASAETAAPEATQAPTTDAIPTSETSTSDAGADTTVAESSGPATGEFQALSGVPGVTDEEISFAVLGTGPAANALGYCLLECYQRGVQAYFDYRNSIGGVNGRQLVIGKSVDDEMGNTQVKALELIEDDSIFGIMGAPLLYTGFADIGKAAVPLYTTFPAAAEANGYDSTYLPTGTTCLDCISPMNVWVAKMAGVTKVGVLGLAHSSSEACVKNNEETFKRHAAATGIELVYSNTDQAFGFPNGLGPQVTAMKEAGVQLVTTCIDQNSALILEQELQRQGMTDVKVVLPQGYGDTAFFEDNADLLEGDLLAVSYRPLEAAGDNAMVAAMATWTGKSDGLFNDYVIQGWLNANLAVEGILAAGPDFDRVKVVAATNTFTEFTDSGMHGPVDWSRQHKAPTPDDAVTNGAKLLCATILVVKGGKLELQGEVAKPFYCFDMSKTEWVDPTQMDFK